MKSSLFAFKNLPKITVLCALGAVPAFAEPAENAAVPADVPAAAQPALPQLKNFPDAAKSDAVYENVEKYYAFGADNVCEFRFRAQLGVKTLAGAGLCRETRIAYNPQFQRVKINAAYVISPDGAGRADLPETAFSVGVPRFAAGAPAFNFLRECVIAHDALEPGSSLFLDYSIFTSDASETLFDEFSDMEFPCDRLFLNFNGAQRESFNLLARSREPFFNARRDVPVIYPGMPRGNARDFCETDGVPALEKQGAEILKTIVNDAMPRREKLAAAAHFVREKIATVRVPESLLREKNLRAPDAVMLSAYGVPAEKARALRAIFLALGEKEAAISRGESDGAYCVKTELGAFPVAEAKMPARLAIREFSEISGETETLRGAAEFSDAGTFFGDAGTLARDFLGGRAPENLAASRTDSGIDFAGTRPLRASDDALVLKTRFSPRGLARLGLDCLSRERSAPLELPISGTEFCESYARKIRLGGGWRLGETPQERTVRNALGEARFSVVADGAEISIFKELRLAKTTILPEEYADFRALLTAWFAPANNRVILQKENSAGTAAN